MKKSTVILIPFTFLLLLFSCKEDDDSTVIAGGSNPTTAANAIIGNWKAFEFVGDKGLNYNLNEFIPQYDTVQGCPVYQFKGSYNKAEVTFKKDSSIFFDIVYTYSEREYTINNAVTCEITYGVWSPNKTESFQDTDRYYVIDNTSYVRLSQDSIFDRFGDFSGFEVYSDTGSYSITNGVLLLDEFVRMRK